MCQRSESPVVMGMSPSHISMTLLQQSQRSTAPTPQTLPAPPTRGSRRARLWELSNQCYCPVLGVGLPLDQLRRIVTKCGSASAEDDDYTIHVCAVGQCTHRNRLSEALQFALDQRHDAAVRTTRACKSATDLLSRWNAARPTPTAPSFFWAILTHPHCDGAVQEQLCRDMHMLQHQAGASARVDAATLEAVVAENGVLARELGSAQARCSAVIAEKAREVQAMQARLLDLETQLLAHTRAADLQAQRLAALQAVLSAQEGGERAVQRLTAAQARIAKLEADNRALRQAAREAARAEPDAPCERQCPQAAADTAPLHDMRQLHPDVAAAGLEDKRILCVGGRNGSIATYRSAVERVGGRFQHHDGGLEDGLLTLESSLLGADLVICQTGCISHNAYWRVKDHCKRTGKQCLFLDNASVSSLWRGLRQLGAPAAQPV